VFDHISRGANSFKTQLGSPCVYASLGARVLGASVVIGGKVGADFTASQLKWLKRRGLSVNRVRRSSAHTTSFRINYQDGKRTMWALARCPSLTCADLAGLPRTSATHMGPILYEIPRTLASSLAARDGIVSLDPQGYLRQILPGGLIGRSKWRNPALLKKLDVLKVSEQEASFVIGRDYASPRKLAKLGPEVILITRGESGTILWSKSMGIFNVPAFRTRVRDPTGAGDALVGALLVTWAKDGDLLWAAAVGSALASFVVESVGPANFGAIKEIQRRASVISDQTKRRGS